jgi:hypothetical protein
MRISISRETFLLILRWVGRSASSQEEAVELGALRRRMTDLLTKSTIRSEI